MKKGFTLIELLATIVLLGLIFIIMFPKIIEVVEKKNTEIDEATKQLIYNGVDTYINQNLNKYPKEIGNQYCISLKELDENGLIPISIDEYLEKVVTVKIGKTNVYEIKNSCENSWIYKDIDNDSTVNVGDEIILGNESFYIISNDGKTVNALSKYNLNIGGEGNGSFESQTYKKYENPTGLQDPEMIGCNSDDLIESEANPSVKGCEKFSKGTIKLYSKIHDASRNIEIIKKSSKEVSNNDLVYVDLKEDKNQELVFSSINANDYELTCPEFNEVVYNESNVSKAYENENNSDLVYLSDVKTMNSDESCTHRYIDEYTKKLQKFGASSSIRARLLNKNDINSIDKNNKKILEWLGATSYWIDDDLTIYQQNNVDSPFLGNAVVANTNNLDIRYAEVRTSTAFGIRPVITLPLSDIKI